MKSILIISLCVLVCLASAGPTGSSGPPLPPSNSSGGPPLPPPNSSRAPPPPPTKSVSRS